MTAVEPRRRPAEPVWCDPPNAVLSSQQGSPVWVEILTPVMDRPTRWALVRTYEKAQQAWTAAGHLVRAAKGEGRTKIPAGRWEFRSHQIERGVPGYGVWAMYLGPPDDEDEGRKT